MSKSRIIRAADVNLVLNNAKDGTPDEAAATAASIENEKRLELEAQLNAIDVLREQIMEDARRESSSMLNGAMAEAGRIIADAKAQAEREKKAIFDESRKKGYAEGTEEGRREGDKLRAQANKLLEETRKSCEDTVKSLEPQLVELVAGVAEKLLGDKAAFRPDTIMCLIRAGLNESRASGEIKVRVSGEDYEAVIANKDELSKLAEGGANLEVVRDLSLNKSDCVIETDFGYIDSSLGQQMAALKENLFYLSNHALDSHEQ